MSAIADPATYQQLKDEIGNRYFRRGPGYNTNWILDRSTPDLLLVRNEDTEILRVKPDGYVRADFAPFELGLDNCIMEKTKHFGIVVTSLVRSANKDAYYALGNEQEIVATASYIEGVFVPGRTATADCLNLIYFIPPQFIPQELAKVPRKVIAQLRAHVEKQYELANIQRRLLSNQQSKWNMHQAIESGDGVVTKIKRALLGGDLTARGELMATNDIRFWKWAVLYYANPASLIDSCRAEFYNAANVRATPKPVEDTLPKFNMVDVSTDSSW